jgi:hypothetical protein
MYGTIIVVELVLMRIVTTNHEVLSDAFKRFSSARVISNGTSLKHHLGVTMLPMRDAATIKMVPRELRSAKFPNLIYD